MLRSKINFKTSAVFHFVKIVYSWLKNMEILEITGPFKCDSQKNNCKFTITVQSSN